MKTLKAPTKANIKRFIYLTSHSCFIPPLKQEYKNLGRRILKYIAQEMALKEGEYEIRWNPGGIAVSGDHILHTQNVYLALHDNLGTGWFYYRRCEGLRDFSGGTNQIVHWKDIENGLEPLIEALKIMHVGWFKDTTGDYVSSKGLVERRAAEALRGINNRNSVFTFTKI